MIPPGGQYERTVSSITTVKEPKLVYQIVTRNRMGGSSAGNLVVRSQNHDSGITMSKNAVENAHEWLARLKLFRPNRCLNTKPIQFFLNPPGNYQALARRPDVDTYWAGCPRRSWASPGGLAAVTRQIQDEPV